MKSDQSYTPFSQRTGLKPIPPQLQLGEASPELRRLLDYYIGLEIDRESHSGYERSYFGEKWNRVAKDMHVIFLGHDANTYKNSPYNLKDTLKIFISGANIGALFDLVEFFIRHQKCSKELKDELAGAFVAARAAYRIVDSQITRLEWRSRGQRSRGPWQIPEQEVRARRGNI